MPFNSYRVLRRGRSLALAPKKSITIQARRGPSPNVAPVSCRSGADVAASSAGQAPPAVAPVPSAGQADVGAEGAPSGVTEQMAAEVIPLPTSKRTELPLALVAPSMVGATPQVEAPMSQVEVAATVTSQAQPNAAMVVPEEAARSVPPAALAMAPEVGRTDGDMAGGSPGIMVVVERTSGGLPSALMSGAAARPCGVSRCSSGLILKTQRRYSSRSTMLPRA